MREKLFIIFLLLLTLPLALAWDTCEVGCTDTVGCGAYIDTDKNGACDHGEPEPQSGSSQFVSLSVPVVEPEDSHDIVTGKELKLYTVEEIAKLYNINEYEYAEKLSDKYKTTITPKDNFQALHDTIELEPSIAKEVALELKQLIPIKENTKTKYKYKFILWSLIPILGYVLTFTLSKKKKITVQNHRKIWNIILTIAFLISGILGLLLVLRINYKVLLNASFMLKWHVEAGIVLAWTSIFHAFWHIPYFKRIFNF